MLLHRNKYLRAELESRQRNYNNYYLAAEVSAGIVKLSGLGRCYAHLCLGDQWIRMKFDLPLLECFYPNKECFDII